MLGFWRSSSTKLRLLWPAWTAFDVANPSVVSRYTHMETHGHVVAAFLEEMKDVRGSACREKCETDCRCSPCTRQGSVEAESGQIGGDGDDEYRSSGMMLADNKWVLK